MLKIILESLNSFMWSYLLATVLLGCALYFTVRSRFVQFRMLREMLRSVGDVPDKSDGERRVSSFEAFTVSLASRVGTGNLAGVAIAISVGGAGAVFWMWVVAILGAANAFVESTLAQLYKRRSRDGFVGGPAYYMERGLGVRWMGVLFAVLISITFGFAFNSVQSNTICGALEHSFGVDALVVGVLLAALIFVVVWGGIHRIAKVSSVVVPFMALGYIALALYVIVTNISHLPSVVGQIVEGAFGWNQALGGAVGMAINEGVKRGLFSNEAGMGSAPNVAASASVSHPVKQGLIQTLGVFVDTLLICSSTAFIILLRHDGQMEGLNGIQITQQALVSEVGSVGGLFLTVAIVLFSFSSIIGNYYYGEANIRFITARRWVLPIYRLAVVGMVLFGALVSLGEVLVFADLMMAFMTLCNLVAISLLGGKALKLLDDYVRQRKAGVVNPRYRHGEVEGLDGDGVECW